MLQTVADVTVSVLEEAGARRCYGVPGDTINHLTDALHRSKIRFVHTRHEETGGFAAGADAVLTGGSRYAQVRATRARCISSTVSSTRIGVAPRSS
jgi:glyoxylate carboligase